MPPDPAAGMLLAIGTAAWLGLLTAVSPCPLATNIAAVAFVGREGASPRRALASGFLYAFGRSAAYVALAAVAVFAVERLLGISTFLQGTFFKLLGPLLILVGMVLTGLIELKLPGRAPTISKERVKRGGARGALLLGAIFALSFCPVSAAIFFGMLVPLAAKHRSVLALPGVYGIATGIPVVLLAVLIAFGAERVGDAFRAAARFERWARPATGVVFIVVGIYETLRGVFGLL